MHYLHTVKFVRCLLTVFVPVYAPIATYFHIKFLSAGCIEPYVCFSINPDERMALMYAARGIKAPINVLWMHLFLKEDDAAAKNLWDEHIAHSPRIMFQHILDEAREKRDKNIVRKLLDLLQDTAVSERARGTAYSCLVDVLGK
jgi:hypothetical protein